MTPIETVTLSAAYVLPIALLGILLATERRARRWVPILVLAALPIFYTGHYFLLQAIQGWPVDSAPPVEFDLLGFDIREPAAGARGEILIWIRSAAQTSPRAHRLPYSRELHQSLNRAGQRLAEGTPQMGRHDRPTGDNQRAGTTDHGGMLSFYDQKPRRLPAKGGD